MNPDQFLKGRTRETQIRRDRKGRWYNGKDPIEHPNLVRSFDGWVDRAEDGRYCLSNDINWAYVSLEGPAYFVRDLTLTDDQILLRLSGEREELLDLSTFGEDKDNALWCCVREGRCPARFDNHAAAKLMDLIEEDDAGVFLRIAGQKIRPLRFEDPLSLGKDWAKS